MSSYKMLKDWKSGFYEWINRRHPHFKGRQNGFMGGFIFGERGKGKSMYCYKVMAKTYWHFNGYTDEGDAYAEALKYMIYEPRDFQKLIITNKIKGIVTPVICLDDASMHFGNMLHITNNKLYSALLGQTATVRTAVTGFMITAPKRCHVVKFLRTYDDYKGEVFIDKGGEQSVLTDEQIRNKKGGRQNWDRKVRFYRWQYYPDEVKYVIRIPFQDKYSCYCPDEYYHWYLEKKLYFEVKHDLEEATRTKENRDVFREYIDDLPSYPGYPDLRQIVKSWDYEEEKEENKRSKEEDKTGRLKGKLKKSIEIKDQGIGYA